MSLEDSYNSYKKKIQAICTSVYLEADPEVTTDQLIDLTMGVIAQKLTSTEFGDDICVNLKMAHPDMSEDKRSSTLSTLTQSLTAQAAEGFIPLDEDQADDDLSDLTSIATSVSDESEILTDYDSSPASTARVSPASPRTFEAACRTSPLDTRDATATAGVPAQV